MRRKKILHITTHFHPFVGGLENMVFQLAKEQSKKYCVSVLTCQYNKNLPLFEKIEGINIYRFPSISILKNKYTIPKFGFLNQIEKLNPDVIFTHTRFFMTSFLGGLNNSESQWIHAEHGQNFVRSKNSIIAVGAWLFDQIFGRYVLKNADKVIVLSKEGQQFVEKFRKNKGIIIISNGIMIPEKIKNPPQKNKVIFFGRLITEKGIEEVLATAKSCLNWSFDIYGTKNNNYESKIKRYKLKNIVLHGEIPVDEIGKKIQDADLSILPSWSEGNSLAILESSANSRPIIATPVGQNKKIVSPQFIVPIKSTESIIQKLNILENNWDMLEKEGLSNLKKVKKFYSFKKMIRSYEEVINL